MEREYTLRSIIALLLNKLWLIIVLTVLGCIAAFGVSKFVLPLKYQSYTSMYVKNSSNRTEDVVNSSELVAAKSLVTTYIAILQDDAVMEVVSDRLIEIYGKDGLSGVFTVSEKNGKQYISSSAIRDCLTMESVDQTEVMKITAVTANAGVSAELCNIIADVASEFLIRVVGAGSVEAIGEAKVNENPVSPNITRNTAIGLLAGLVLACGLIIVIDVFDNTVKSSEDLTRRYSKSILGEIQDFSPEKKKKTKSGTEIKMGKTLLDADVPFNVTESYKALRTNLIFALATGNKKIIAVTSANPGEGKSTVSANLAITLAQMEHKVLLIDSDMRKPVLHKYFKIKNKIGLSSVIGGMNKSDECVQKHVADNLDIIPSGPQPPNPSELVGSQKMEELLAELAGRYDYIIIDTPPVNVVSDVLGLSTSIAGVVMVLNYGNTTFEETENAMSKISFAEIPLLGFVLNNIERGRHGGSYNYKYKYKNGYGYGYGYGYNRAKDEEAQQPAIAAAASHNEK